MVRMVSANGLSRDGYMRAMGHAEPEPIAKRGEGMAKGKKKVAGKKWIKSAINPKHKGYCTPMSKATCTPKRKALARTLKKMGRARKGK